LQGWHCLLLAIGFSLLFLATVASKCLPSSIATRPLAVRAIASIVIFQSSMDTLFATVAVVTCVTVYILIRLINDQVTWEKRKLKRLRGRESTKVRSGETVKVARSLLRLDGIRILKCFEMGSYQRRRRDGIFA
ncbi:hypothetical protein Tco_1423517, partial [Tanacetum coccineum]